MGQFIYQVILYGPGNTVTVILLIFYQMNVLFLPYLVLSNTLHFDKDSRTAS